MLGTYGNVWKACKDPRFLPAFTLKRQGNELVRDFSLGCRPFEGTYLTSMFDYDCAPGFLWQNAIYTAGAWQNVQCARLRQRP